MRCGSSDTDAHICSFFANKGAVAGTFTAVGLVALAAIAAIGMHIMRRRSHAKDEEDAAYFEKYSSDHDDLTSNSPHGASVGDGAGATADAYYAHGKNASLAQITTPAASDAYPDRSLHYGYGDASASASGAATGAGVDLPPGTAYAAAANSQGTYQYPYQYPYQSQSQAQYQSSYPYAAQSSYPYTAGNNDAAAYSSQERVSPGPHPFADPTNAVKSAGAPPVQVVVTSPTSSTNEWRPDSVYVGDEGVGEAQ